MTKIECNGIDFELKHDVKPSKAIMLFHGLTGSPFEMKKYGNFLFKEGYDVYCYTLPGHGSMENEIESITWQDWVDFSQEKYDFIRDDYDDFFLSGICFGALISIYLAIHNKNVNAVISLSATVYLDGWSIPWYNFMMPLGLNTILRYFYTFPEREPYGIKNKIVRRKVAKLMSKTTAAMDNFPLSCIYELLKFSKYIQKNIKVLSQPILLIHSIEDDLTSIKSSKFLYDNVSSKIKEYVELKNSYHMVLYDFEKEFVYEKSLSFMEQHVYSIFGENI